MRLLVYKTIWFYMLGTHRRRGATERNLVGSRGSQTKIAPSDRDVPVMHARGRVILKTRGY